MKNKLILVLVAMFSCVLPSCVQYYPPVPVARGGYTGGYNGSPPPPRIVQTQPNYDGGNYRVQSQGNNYYTQPQYGGGNGVRADGYNPAYGGRNQSTAVMMNPPGVNTMGFDMWKARGGGAR